MFGRVKWYDGNRAFGFVTADDGNDYFVHANTLSRCGMAELIAGDPVEFEIEENRGRLRVATIKPA